MRQAVQNCTQWLFLPVYSVFHIWANLNSSRPQVSDKFSSARIDADAAIVLPGAHNRGKRRKAIVTESAVVLVQVHHRHSSVLFVVLADRYGVNRVRSLKQDEALETRRESTISSTRNAEICEKALRVNVLAGATLPPLPSNALSVTWTSCDRGLTMATSVRLLGSNEPNMMLPVIWL
jgi:hypothetical protein